ncbi:MAG: DUF4177 domain-containing protein [Pseudomonadota bacterium]
MSHEYKVVPAPTKGMKAKGVKGTPSRFAHALEVLMNDLAKDGWEYQRTDTLPVEERQGLTGKTTSFQNMLVFRRAVAAEDPPDEVTALIEDKSADPVAAPSSFDAKETSETATETTVAEGSDRVDETIGAPFVYPWVSKRQRAQKADDKTDRDTDSDQIPAE